MNKTQITPYRQLDLKIYGYHLPDVPTHKGNVKVGETTLNDVRDRIVQQTGTVGVRHEFLFQRNAIRNDGRIFHDRDLHAYFRLRGIKRAMLNGKASEWYQFGDVSRAESMTDEYIAVDYDEVQISKNKLDYILRAEQALAVETTIEYAKNPIHGAEFLWNAKPRFGKTLTTYDFARKIRAKNILIVTNRPAIANSWYDDFVTFIAWQEPGMKFVSETSALADRSPMSRDEFLQYAQSDPDEKINIRCLAFLSLQDLKGARFAGGEYDKLEWVAEMDWDLLVIDEAHEGIDTLRTDRAFEKIDRRFTLHLSGTPFKAIASQKFHADQIFNWSYLDEQEAKNNWDEAKNGTNPYASLPTLNLFTYQMSKIIEQQLAEGMSLENEETLDYAFDLNEFFGTKEDGKFIYEADVIRFLDNLHARKFPFAENEHQQELNHTFWLLPRVAAAKAMEKLLNDHPFFKDYTVVLAAGDGKSLPVGEEGDQLGESATDASSNKRSFDRVKAAIASNPRTITLSVGQLTTGVTIPEWTAVLMLSNIKSPAVYFQAAFRAQNPWEFERPEKGEWFRKENAYVFDFAPERTLLLFDEFANNLKDEGIKASEAERKENIRELINFFPVIAEDEEGKLREISSEEVLTIPNQIKAVEVVKRGFMSNLLFANIGAIFSAPAELKAILDKISPEANKRLTEKREIEVSNPMLNERGEVAIPPEIVINSANGLFGEKIYKTDIQAAIDKFADIADRENAAAKISKEIVGQLNEGFKDAAKSFGSSKKAITPDTRAAEKILTQKIEENLYQRDLRLQKAKREYEESQDNQTSQQSRELNEELYHAEVLAINENLHQAVKASVEAVTQNFVEKQIVKKEEEKKKKTEDDVRDHLRGFARTIPAFLMAYGNADTSLATFDQNIEPGTFEELTSITLDEFRMLRDGLEIADENGQKKMLPGLFNEGVFNNAVREFFNLKDKLGDYLHGNPEKDIFDYIPPQKTNQIFTPRRVVRMMVDLLEENDPQIFSHKETTFIDLYTKSGLYLTEIAKRLFLGLAQEIPDEGERIRWILEKQLFGCAPSNIIYNMVKNYVYAGFPSLSDANLIELDLTEAAKAGKVREALAERYGTEMKFDVIIGNPPYQETGGGGASTDGAVPVYQEFVNSSFELSSKYVSMIIPSKWMIGGRGLKDFRSQMVKNKNIIKIIDYENPMVCFPGVHIDGGVCYFLWDKHHLDEPNHVFITNDGEYLEKKRNLKNPYFDFVVRDFRVLEILKKVSTAKSFKDMVSYVRPFGIRNTLFNDPDSYPDIGFQWTNFLNSVRIFGVIGIKGGAKRTSGYIKRSKVMNNIAAIDQFKLFFTTSYSTNAIKPPEVIFAGPGDICTETFLLIGPFINKQEAENCAKYINTDFFRFFLFYGKGTMHVTREVFSLIPMQDFSSKSEIIWSDSITSINYQLYKKYLLSDEEILFIKSKTQSV